MLNISYPSTYSFCGRDDFIIWDKTHNNFGVCFQKSVLCGISYSFLAIFSAFYAGRRTSYYARTRKQYYLIILRVLISFLLLLLSIVEPFLLHLYGHIQFFWVDIFSYSIQSLSWISHLVYLGYLRNSISSGTRGKTAVIVFWVSTLLCSITASFSLWFTPDSFTTDEDLIYLRRIFVTTHLSFQVVYLLTLFPRGRGDAHLSNNTGSNERTPLINTAYATYGRFHETFDPFHLGVAEEGVNKFSYLTFHWVNLLMEKGSQRLLDSVDDLYDLPHSLKCDTVSQRIQAELLVGRPLDSVPDGDPSVTFTPKHQLLRALRNCFGRRFLAIGVLKLLGDCLGFASPLLLHIFIEYVDGSGEVAEWQGFSSAAGLCICSLLSSFLLVHFNYLMSKLNVQIRAALITTIYRKIQNVSASNLTGFSSGQILNLMSTDSDRVVNFCQSFHALWSLPLQLTITLVLLYNEIGIAFLAGIAFAVILIPINKVLANKIGSLSTKMMQFKDKRLDLMKDVLSRIKEIKWNSWENLFKNKVMKERQGEVDALAGRKYLDAACVYFWATSPVLIPVFAFGTYVLLGNEMKPSKVFTAIALFNMLIAPLNAFPWVLNGVVEAWVSLKRIESLLQVDDYNYDEYYTIVPDHNYRQADMEVLMLKASFSWGRSLNARPVESQGAVGGTSSEGREQPASQAIYSDLYGNGESERLTLKDVDIQFNKNQIVAIVGAVGSGKSAMLNAILGELKRISGVISVASLHQGFGFATQSPWLQNLSIKENILFGSPFDSSKYKAVIGACALEEDLRTFPKGDETKCGENGTALSGGQRARVALARAVYQNRSVYLLDDILSSVDGGVANQIMDRCIHGILRGSTVVMVTHHIHLLSRVDWVIHMDNGAVKMQGLPGDILPHLVLRGNHSKLSWSKEPINSNSGAVPKNKLPSSKFSKTGKDKILSIPSGSRPSSEDDGATELETRSFGELGWDVIFTYLSSAGVGICVLVFFALVLMQATRNMADVWLAKWVSHPDFPVNGSFFEFPESGPRNQSSLGPSLITDLDDRRADRTTKFYLEVYAILAVSNSMFTLLRAFLFAFGGIFAASAIHRKLLEAVIHCRLGFFDLNPTGRILNRFSTDIFVVDDSLPFQGNIFLAQIFGLGGSLFITIYGLPWIVLLYIPLMFMYYTIQQFYRHTSRELRRVYALSLSPLYTHFTDTLNGLTVIRAMRAGHRFSVYTDAFLEQNQRAQFSLSVVSQWLNLRLQLIGVGILAGVVLLSLWQHHMTGIGAGLVGLVISYALTINGSLNGVVTSLTETERELISVERISHYLKGAVQEGQVPRFDALVSSMQDFVPPPPIALPYGWPSQGQIEFEGVYLKYHDHNPYSLRNVSFKIFPLEKVGVVGRTGAGKSSLLTALFRLVELCKGKIFIDHIDVSEVALKKLRTSMAIVSQDVLLFTGTVRENLDPRSENLDREIQSALDQCRLSSVVLGLGGLDAPMKAGEELSAGERQLFGLARALLSRTKIVCLDEGTALLDTETEALLQSVIRDAFRNKTVIVVAHRLNSIKDCQRVIVMDDGEVAEIGRPSDLLDNPESIFSSIVRNHSS